VGGGGGGTLGGLALGGLGFMLGFLLGFRLGGLAVGFRLGFFDGFLAVGGLALTFTFFAASRASLCVVGAFPASFNFFQCACATR
jgi:hypothetical protein